MSEIIGKKPKVTKVGSKNLYSNKDLETALKVMKSLGFKVFPPSTEEEIIKQETSMKKLGFSAAVRKVTETEREPKFLRATLGATHNIGGESYGPGIVEIPIEQVSLFNTLLHQDVLSRDAHLDTKDYNPKSRCFMIGQKGVKKEVSENTFNSDTLPFEPAITAGALDVAGFNSSNSYNENRIF